MKILVVGSKTTFIKTYRKYAHQIDTQLEYTYSEDTPDLSFKLIASPFTEIIYFVSPHYKAIKSLLNYALILKSADKPTLHIQCLIGDVRMCKRGYISVESFEDTQTFGDIGIEDTVKYGLSDIYYRTRQLINEYHPPIQDLYTASFNKALTAYDIELTTQPVPYLKRNVWHTDEDYRSKNGIADKDRFTVHVEERYKYKATVTLFDRIMAWLSLNEYIKIGIPPLHRVITNGKDYKVINLSITSISDIDDDFHTTPMYVDTSYTHEQFEKRSYIVPRSECGQLHKVKCVQPIYDIDLSENYMI